MFAPGLGGWLDSLNPAQLEAVTHGSGPALVVAGAGSGKTWTLACRVAYLLQQGVAPERILLLTFTRRAARELLQRADRLIAGERTRAPSTSLRAGVWGGTFHAVANRLLRLHGQALGLDPSFTVLDQADTVDVMHLIREELSLAQRGRRFPRPETLAAIYSRTVNGGVGSRLGHVLDDQFPWCKAEIDGIRSLFEQYTCRKRDQLVLDYDDLLLYWAALVRSPAADKVEQRFDHVLVDEYQDTNPLQAQILIGLRQHNRNLMVVGDDAQAIYSFRSATVRNILDFPSQFPGTRLIKLERNYRSTSSILDASNAVISFSRARHEKVLWSDRTSEFRPTLLTCMDDAAQAEAVCTSILAHREEGTALREQAVLFRASHHSDTLELELTRRGIPYVKYGGLKFLEAAHVKDVLAILRVLENPYDDVGWFRVLQLLEGIGPATARRLLAELGVRPRGSTNPLELLLATPPQLPHPAHAPLAALSATLEDCRGTGPEPPPAAQIGRIRRFLEPVFERRYDSAAARLADVDQLEQLAGSYRARGPFISELTLDPPQSTSDLAGPPLLDDDYLILSTIHSAKGGEWDVVHVIHAADGVIPSDMATGDDEQVEEERRLLYVALTRARNRLHVYFPLRYYQRGRGVSDAHSYAQLTRFLPASIQHLFEQRSTPPSEPEPPAALATTDGRAAVDAFLSELWRDEPSSPSGQTTT
jgi:DNA helicase-2/ATP-dependent DNA helicase PcrA